MIAIYQAVFETNMQPNCQNCPEIVQFQEHEIVDCTKAKGKAGMNRDKPVRLMPSVI
jgi:hypothetical protein